MTQYQVCRFCHLWETLLKKHTLYLFYFNEDKWKKKNHTVEKNTKNIICLFPIVLNNYYQISVSKFW